MESTCAVVIPARNSASTLRAAVGSVHRQTAAVDQIVIAVGPSHDDTETIANALSSECPRVRVVANPSGTIPSGLNAAIAASTGEVIVRVDAHAELPPDYVAAMIGALEDSRVANAGGRQYAVGRTAMERAVAAALMSRFGAGGAAFHLADGEPRAVDTVYLGSFRRAVIDEVGGFDESLLSNEDYELNWRIRQAGYLVWLDPNIKVAYRPRGSIREVGTQFWRYGWWKFQMLRRHPGSLRPRQAAAPLLVVGLFGSAALAPWQPLAALIVPSAYGVCCLCAAFIVSARTEPSLAPRLLAVLATMHLAWGGGFLASALSSLLRHRPVGSARP